MVLSIINSVSVAIVFPKHNRVQEPHTASAPTVAWRPAVAFLRGEGRSAGFSETLNQYAYQNQHLVCRLLGPHCREWRGTSFFHSPPCEDPCGRRPGVRAGWPALRIED